jgi:hypothetical protein
VIPTDLLTQFPGQAFDRGISFEEPLVELIIVAISLLIVTQSAVDKSVEDRFLKEYPKSSMELETRLSTVKGIARVFDPKGISQVVPQTSVTFAVNGPVRKFEYSKIIMATNKPTDTLYVVCASGSTSFRLKRVGESPYQIQGIGSDLAEQAIFRTVFGKYLDAPWAIYGLHLTGLIKAADFRLTTSREIDTDQGRVVEIEFYSGSFNGQPSWYRVRLDPGIDWAIIESEYRPGSSSVNPETLKIEYSTATGHVFPKRIQSKGLDGKENVCEFSKIEFSATPASEFRMEHYGLKDVTNYAPKDSSHLHWWLIAVAVVVSLFAGSVALKKMAHRRL